MKHLLLSEAIHNKEAAVNQKRDRYNKGHCYVSRCSIRTISFGKEWEEVYRT